MTVDFLADLVLKALEQGLSMHSIKVECFDKNGERRMIAEIIDLRYDDDRDEVVLKIFERTCPGLDDVLEDARKCSGETDGSDEWDFRQIGDDYDEIS